MTKQEPDSPILANPTATETKMLLKKVITEAKAFRKNGKDKPTQRCGSIRPFRAVLRKATDRQGGGQ